MHILWKRRPEKPVMQASRASRRFFTMDNVFPEKNFLENRLLIVKKSPAAQLSPGRQNRQGFPQSLRLKRLLVAGLLAAIG